MATIESKDLLVWVKAMSRGQALPLDASEIHSSYEDAVAYAATATAYGGQTIKALLDDGKYHSYVIQPSDAGYVLEELGSGSSGDDSTNTNDTKQYIAIVDNLPNSGQEQGILYIVDTTAYLWTGSEWKTIFKNITLEDRLGDIPEETTVKEYVDSAVETVKSYMDAQIELALTIVEF